MAIDIENAVNTLYGTAPISDAPGVEAAEQTVGESQQVAEQSLIDLSQAGQEAPGSTIDPTLVPSSTEVDSGAAAFGSSVGPG